MNPAPTRPARRRKPPWIRVRAPGSPGYVETRRLVHGLRLHTVCEEARCPNIGDCWERKHATVMILGDVCTRSCGFCAVRTGRPGEVDQSEPRNLAVAAEKLGLRHVVITSVDRDDLPDGGAAQFVASIEAIRRATSETTIEVLTPDFRRKPGAIEVVARARPEVYGHNLETAPRLYPVARKGADYPHSLDLLARVKAMEPATCTKSGIMLGLGETSEEIDAVMDDLRRVRVDFITLGQYLQPTLQHLPVERYVAPDEFDQWSRIAREKGFRIVSSSPLARSSYYSAGALDEIRPAWLAARDRSGAGGQPECR